MGKRFDLFYLIKRGMNLADPEVWNVRFRDIDRRVDANETALQNLDAVADRVEATALDRINNVVTPLVVEVITRLQSIANLFTATSVSEVEIGIGTRTFIIAEGERNTFAAVEWVTAHPIGDDTVGVTGSRVSYNAETGALVLDVQRTVGSGTFNAWRLSVSLPPDLTTLAVVRGGVDGARDTLKKLSDAVDAALALEATARAEAVSDEATARDVAIASAIAAIKGGVSTAYDTLQEIAAWIANDESVEAGITTALGNRLRFDAAQSLTTTQKRQARANAGLAEGNPRSVGLIGFFGATAAVSCLEAVVVNPTTGDSVRIANPGTITADPLTVGANGRDRAAALSSDFCHLYYIWNGTALAMIFSPDGPATGPTLPSGYSHWSYVATAYWNGSNAFRNGYLRGSWVIYTVEVVAYSGTPAESTDIAVSATTLIPANALQGKFTSYLFVQNDTNGTQHNVQIKTVSGEVLATDFIATGSPSGYVGTRGTFDIPNRNQLFYFWYGKNAGNNSALSVSVGVLGYQCPNGGE